MTYTPRSNKKRKSIIATPTPTSNTIHTIHTIHTPVSNAPSNNRKPGSNSKDVGRGTTLNEAGGIKVDVKHIGNATQHDIQLPLRGTMKQQINLSMTPEIRLFMYQRRSQPTISAVCNQSHKLKQSELYDIWKSHNTTNDTVQAIIEHTPAVTGGILQPTKPAVTSDDYEQVAKQYQLPCPIPYCPEYIHPTLTVNDLYTDSNKYSETVPFISKSQLQQQVELYVGACGTDGLILSRLIKYSPLLLWNLMKHHHTVENGIKSIYRDSNRSMNRHWKYYETSNQLI